MGILMGGVIRDAVSHAPLPFASACVTGTIHCYSTDGNGLWNNLSDGGAYAYSGVNVTCSAGGHYSKSVNMTSIAYYPDLGINGLWEVVELDRTPPPPPSCCFTGETLVRMADGSIRRIDLIAAGDAVVGRGGAINRVTGVHRPALGSRSLHAFNDGRPFVTAEHPFLTTAGWKSIDPDATAAENAALSVEPLARGDRLVVVTRVHAPAFAGASGDTVEIRSSEYELRTVVAHPADPTTIVYNLELDGEHTFIANGFLVHNKSSH